VFICDLFPAVIATVRNEDEEVRLAPVPFLQSYANKLKASLKRINVLPEVPPPPACSRSRELNSWEASCLCCSHSPTSLPALHA